MMLYDTIRNEGAMQKAAMTLNVLGTAAGEGGGLGALTNDGNRAAGALGGAVGAPLAMLASGRLLDKLNIAPGGTGAMFTSFVGAPLAGGYLGGKLGAKLDSATGSNLTKLINKLLGRD